MPTSAAEPQPTPDAAQVVLEAVGLEKRFRKGPEELTVLRSVDLTLGAGETVSIVGASGAGKSTLLHVLGGLESPSAGTVRVLGEDFYGLDDGRRAALRNRRVGFVFQFHHLLREFTALENVMMPALIGRGTPAEARERATALLDQVGLAARLTHRPGELSGGEQQRVALARALVQDPAIVLADEPTGNLDAATGRRVFDTLLDLNERLGTSLLMVTHNPELAAETRRSLTMTDGVLGEGGTA